MNTMDNLAAHVRVVAATMLICVAGYTAVILGVAQAVAPDTANGWLVRDDAGTIIGSRQIAQEFTQPAYFWPRPSAVDYDGAGAGGSNLSPTSDALTERANEIVQRYGATADRPLPPELAAASGGGLDPHISEGAAVYQVSRVARARGMSEVDVTRLIETLAFRPGGLLTPDRIVNVLELNLALDRM